MASQTRPLSDSELKDLRIRIVQAREKKYPWPELSQEIFNYHETQQKLIGKGIGGRPRDGEPKKGWGIRDSARELGLSIGTFCEYINLARALKNNPSIKDISLDRALALIRKKR